MGVDKVNGVVEVYIVNNIEEAKKTGYLNLSFCNLIALPDTMFELTNLQALSLQHNYLTTLPDRITQLTGLTELYLESNQLETLPAFIGQLVNLKKLHLKSNRLTTLPPEIGLLTNLVELDLSSNQLIALPPEITQLTNLKNLFVSGNPLQTPPLELANRGMEAIINYFKNSNTVAISSEKPTFPWNDERNLRFEYHYKRAARQVMALFSNKQREREWIENNLQWVAGMVLNQENTRALVELDPSQSIISICVDGDNKKDFLRTIRRDFQNIHQSLGLSDAREAVSCICNQCAREPHMFPLESLKKSLAEGQYKVICPKSGEDISIAEIFGEFERAQAQETEDPFEGWRPENMGDIKFIVQKGQVVVLHGQHSATRYTFEHVNQIIYELIKKKINSEKERRNMVENLHIIKNPNADKARRQAAAALFKVFITYLSENGEDVMAGFLYEAVKNLPLMN
jgi:hypothetical protein